MNRHTPFSRRHFLTLAAGAASASTLGGCSVAGSSPRSSVSSKPGPRLSPLLKPAPAPADVMSFVSRPDLKPVAIAASGAEQFAGIAGVPRYVFLAPANLGASPVDLPGGAQPGPMIVDLRGDLVWFRPSPQHAIFNFTPQTYRGRPVVSWWSGTNLPTFGEGSYVVADSSYSTVATVSGADGLQGDLHEFVITPQDTALFTSYQQGSSGGVSLEDGIAFEVDIASGDVVFAWRSLDPGHVAVSETYLPPPKSGAWDYFHINSISLWPGAERDLLISARNTCAVYRVARSTGAIVWRLGGKRSDFKMTDRTRFWWQHDARPLSDGSGVSLFDDASLPPERSKGDPQSRGIVLEFGPRKGELRLAREYLHSDTKTAGNEAGFMGNVQLLANGSCFVGWGGQIPYFSGYGRPSAGAVHPPLLFDGRLPAKTFSYRAYTADWVGDPPLSELAVVVRPAPAGSSDAWHAYASWNGSTEVESWKVSAGKSPHDLSSDHVAARRGFETAIPITVGGSSGSSPPFVHVQALDHSGKVLGSSQVVQAQVP